MSLDYVLYLLLSGTDEERRLARRSVAIGLLLGVAALAGIAWFLIKATAHL